MVEYCRTKLQISALFGLSSLAIFPPLIAASMNHGAAASIPLATQSSKQQIAEATVPVESLRQHVHAASRRDRTIYLPSRRKQSPQPQRQSTAGMAGLPVRSARPPKPYRIASLPTKPETIPSPGSKPSTRSTAIFIPFGRHPKRALASPSKPRRVASLTVPVEAIRIPKATSSRRSATPLIPLARHPEEIVARALYNPEMTDRVPRVVVASVPRTFDTPQALPNATSVTTISLPTYSPRMPRPEVSRPAGPPLPVLASTSPGMPKAEPAPPYIPWAQRQANKGTTGPVHGNPHLAPHVAPFTSNHKPGTIIVHVNEKRLYLVESARTARVYPIGTARGNLDILGRTFVTTRRFRPTWTPTPNQRERDPTLPRRVEAGPENPLGIRALGLGWRYRLIHGTSDPSSIGFARSDGCIRMLNDDVADLFNRVRVGNPVLVLASAGAELVETRPPGYVEYSPRWKRILQRGWRKQRRYAARKKRRRRK